MLTSEVKRRIDTARDILVGKVPTPTAQVEQITIALIYKFMDDMDAQAEEFGGKRSFFAGEYAQYGWSKLMHSGLGGHEMLNLYAEAIAKMPENPGIPKLFREIFKNAFLPYRDPETLREFLKIIDVFIYDHSEDLGDAYEYLLSVLGSQGDAGQFRTPRHIIDFMVAIIDPKKDESILDPACGTSGFLISAYKHIMAANTDASGECSLTPDEKKRLAANITGYDISPDMVRLSQVNLYLHGFVDPHIYEYDTLTSQEKWGEYAGIILANPPFMSPKGGIKPHNRFSIQSKRSEVLFIDYIVEHLTPTGRSAAIVPEGIIFQSQKAYKQLRKLLVEEYLVAVVSLPAGLFQPYSGVKTSILVMDKALARQRNTVAFFTVNNDGFSLGAQRRPIEQNDLPGVHAELVQYVNALRAGKDVTKAEYAHGHVVKKEKIAEGGEYNLSGERYRRSSSLSSYHSFIAIKNVAVVESGFGFPVKSQGRQGLAYPFYKVSDMNLPKNEIYMRTSNNTISEEDISALKLKLFPEGTIIFPKIGAAIATNKKRMLTCRATFDNNVMGIIPNTNLLISEYLYAYLKKINLSDWASLSQPPSMRKTTVEDAKIPLPPLEIQKEIVAEIEGYQKIIDGGRAVVENYRPQILANPEWEQIKLESVLKHVTSGATPKGGASSYVKNEILFIRSQNVLSGYYDFTDAVCITPETHADMKRSQVCNGDVLLNITGASIGRSAYFDLPMAANVNQHVAILRANKSILPVFLMHLLNSDLCQHQIFLVQAGASREALNYTQIKELIIPLPSLEVQQQIVAEIEAEQALVNANKELITRFERKIDAVLARVWGDAEETTVSEEFSNFKLPDLNLQFPLPGREAWAKDTILSAIRHKPRQHFEDYYEAAALGTVPILCADLLPPERAVAFNALVQKHELFVGCEEQGQCIRKELMQDELEALGVQISPSGCILGAEVSIEREAILAPVLPYLFEALHILRDVVGGVSTSQRIKHLTPQKQQQLIEIWNQGAVSAA